MILSPSVRRLLSCAAALAAGVGVVFTPSFAGAARAEPAPPRAAAPPDPALLYRPGVHLRARQGVPALPDDISALSWLVADAGSGDVLAAHDAHLGLPPASTMKTLFALTALPRLPRTGTHTVTDEELAQVGEGSSLVGLDPGRTYQIADLWKGVFLSSGNDAVHVLAAMNGGWAQTAAQMQARARALGARDTHVVSPDGYDADGQVSSAYDLAVFGRAGLADPDFARYAALADAPFPGDTDAAGRPSWTYGIENTNRLLTGEDGVERYPGIIGIKNGYTSSAGFTLVTAARRGGRTLLVTVMNPQQGGAFAVYDEARALLDWGFAAAGRVDPVGSLQPPPAKFTRTGPPPVAAATSSMEPETGYAWSAVLLAGAGAAGTAVYRLRRRLPHRKPGSNAGPDPDASQRD
ncbi:D-alanyl-D-alanine carboxypeptidase [Streptomyces sp. WM6372]|uniref:D-alanyl-D-alanine carboxypeptidase family protein n=1 Tax=Streptomyces sp. WM6372 TaxID=1415555 RepID=UPI0006AF36C6|nr:serine hydrolase [Streptomyces sp. WM6372]KOU14505.1 D-alanyl-D-alanine carboxypeptidase [Streptomyces sp. WM6372]